MGDPIDDLGEKIIVDTYGEHEQLSWFRQVFDDEARFPLRGRVVGVEVKVLSVDFDGNERRGLIALCRRGDEVHTVSLLDVTPDRPLPRRTRQLFDARPRSTGASRISRWTRCPRWSSLHWSLPTGRRLPAGRARDRRSQTRRAERR